MLLPCLSVFSLLLASFSPFIRIHKIWRSHLSFLLFSQCSASSSPLHLKTRTQSHCDHPNSYNNIPKVYFLLLYLTRLKLRVFSSSPYFLMTALALDSLKNCYPFHFAVVYPKCKKTPPPNLFSHDSPLFFFFHMKIPTRRQDEGSRLDFFLFSFANRRVKTQQGRLTRDTERHTSNFFCISSFSLHFVLQTM